MSAPQDPGMPPRRLSRLVLIAISVGFLFAALLYIFYAAARPDSRTLVSGTTHQAADGVTPSSTAASASSSSAWRALSGPEQTALEPLAGEWDKLDVARQRKWLALADRFPHMTAVEQTRTQERMREWIRLTPEERRVARETYLRAHSLPPEKRAELLQQYQQLPDDQKEQLAEQARQHHSVMAVRAHPHEEPLPNKAQIKEGVRQSGPGLDMAKGTPAVSVATAPAIGTPPSSQNAVVTSTAQGGGPGATPAVSTSTAGGAGSSGAVSTSTAPFAGAASGPSSGAPALLLPPPPPSQAGSTSSSTAAHP